MDSSILKQVETAFAGIQKEITLLQSKSSHSKDSELTSMLSEVASTSTKVSHVVINQDDSRFVDSGAPFFTVLVDGESSGIEFEGVPGGHEFTSLILAILYSAGLGKQADARTIQRIQSIASSAQLEIFVSLDCTNCPDMVQASHYMASLNPQISARMIEGSVQADLAKERGVLSVPTIFLNGEKIHTGRGSLGDLLEKVISASQVTEADSAALEPKPNAIFDVLVLGGGPAGVSAAIYAARKGLKVGLVADQMGGQVKETKGIENLISTPYTEGPKLTADLTKHLEDYPVEMILNQRVQSVNFGEEVDTSSSSPSGVVKSLQLTSGETLKYKTLIIATGSKWRELGVPGEKEYKGSGVAYCPHCDGPLFKGKEVAVVGGGNSGVEAAIDLAGTSKSVTLFEFTDALKADQVLVDKLNSLSNVSVHLNTAVQEILGDGQKVNGLQYAARDGGDPVRLDLDGVFVQIGLQPNSEFLGESVEKSQMGEVVIDPNCKTSVAGVFAAGDVSTVAYKQIIIAMGEGAKAGLSAFDYLMRS